MVLRLTLMNPTWLLGTFVGCHGYLQIRQQYETFCVYKYFTNMFDTPKPSFLITLNKEISLISFEIFRYLYIPTDWHIPRPKPKLRDNTGKNNMNIKISIKI